MAKSSSKTSGAKKRKKSAAMKDLPARKGEAVKGGSFHWGRQTPK